MKLLYFKEQQQYRLGIATERGVFDVDQYQKNSGGVLYSGTQLTRDVLNDLQTIVSNSSLESSYFRKEDELTIGPCVPFPSKIICIGLNYRKHAIESNMDIPTVPVVFTKYNNTLVDFGGDVELGNAGSQFDYEVELGVVIGKKAKNISREEALHYVLGYCVANDLSCRDLQFRSSQWLMGKTLDHFLPLGKCIVTHDEIGDPQNLLLEAKVNGEKRQSSNTSDMIFTVTEIIEDLTKHFTLLPGDLILTGTPEGVAMGMPDKPWLKPGDEVDVSIEKIGHSINKMS